MSTSKATATNVAPATEIEQTLKDLLKKHTRSTRLTTSGCDIEPTVLSKAAIAEIATLKHIRDYIGRPNRPPVDIDIVKDIGHFPGDDLDKIAALIEQRARKLFVLTVVYDYGTMFVREMVDNLDYDEAGWPDLMHAETEVRDTHIGLRNHVVEHQGMVLAPTIEFGDFELVVEKGALPFQKKAAITWNFWTLYPNAHKIWEVELGEDFQKGGFGTMEFHLVEYVLGETEVEQVVALGRKKALIERYKGKENVEGNPVAGFTYCGLYYYLLFKRPVVAGGN